MVRRLLHFTRSSRTYRLGQRRVFRMLLTSLRSSPHPVALGFAIGVFVAFTPTVGLQMVIAALIATLLRANRPASVIPVWITNPATIPPIYLFTYKIGTFFYDGPPTTEVYHALMDMVKRLGELEFFAFFGAMRELLALGKDAIIPMTIGGVIVGGIGAVIAYALLLWGVGAFHKFMELRRKRRRRRL